MWRDVPKDIETSKRWKLFPATESAKPGSCLYALTFDDGPDDYATPAILNALDSVNAKATFFMVGEQVERWPEIARDVALRGHEVACHGFSHGAHPERPDREVEDDLHTAVEAIEQATGIRPGLFRPPYGHFSEASYKQCDELGMRPIYWSSWGIDWDPIDAATIAENVLGDLQDGSIVLLHDAPSYADRSSALATAEASTLVATQAKELGLKAVTVSKLLKDASRL